jgi:predicted AAA+ superfamily ATPase
MKIPRIFQNLDIYLKPNKVVILFGPRQVGKTTLLQDYLKTCTWKYKLDSGDNIRTHHILGSGDFSVLKEYVFGYELLAIDEAQRIPGIGLGLKILVDQVPGLRVVATGSSSFELAGQLGEPLTGRKSTLILFPVSQIELAKLHNQHELKEKLEEWLIFGGYPEVVITEDKREKARILEELVQSYLLKDILEIEKVKNSKVLLDLLRLLAFQVGSEVSLTELSQHLGIDYKTVGRYCDLLEKAFVVYNVRGFSRNLRKEITRTSKYYYYDNGVRNAVISNFNGIGLRNDAGMLWENFLSAERMKKCSYQGMYRNVYFWRTWEQQEIDIVEERDGSLFGYECKWGVKTVKAPTQWQAAYPGASFEAIDKNNYLSFIT